MVQGPGVSEASARTSSASRHCCSMFCKGTFRLNARNPSAYVSIPMYLFNSIYLSIDKLIYHDLSTYLSYLVLCYPIPSYPVMLSYPTLSILFLSLSPPIYRSMYLSAYLSIYLCIQPSIHPYLCLPPYLYLHLHLYYLNSYL